MDQPDPFVQLPLFEGLNPEQITLLRPLFIPCDCPAGALIFAQGAPAEWLFIVISGEVVVRYKPDDGPELVLSRARPSGMVGWSAVLGREHYTSSAFCVTYTRLLRVRGSDLRSLCDRCPETGELLLERLAGAIAERLRNTNEQVVDLIKQSLAFGH